MEDRWLIYKHKMGRFLGTLFFLLLVTSGLAMAAPAPGNLKMDAADDTAGESNSDGITYIGNPLFTWSKPSGTVIQYQWAVTAASDNPWDGPRIVDDFTPDTSKRPGTLSDGQYKFWVQAEGPSSGDWDDWASYTFRIDTQSPTVPTGLTNPGGASSTEDNTPNVTWSSSSDSGGSGVWIYDVKFTKGSTTHIFASGNTTLVDSDYGGETLPDGNWSWQVRSIDIAGNVSGWSSGKTIMVDTTAPSTPTGLTNPGGSSVTTDTKPNVFWSASSDSGTGVASYNVKFVKGGTTHTFSSVNTSMSDSEFGGVSLADGTWTWQVQAVDSVDNKSSWSSGKIITIDTQGPYAPGDIRMSQSHDTAGESDSDGITYIGNPQFEWTKPSDRGTSGTKDYYQWAVTAASDNPWDGPRIVDDFTPDTSKRPGTLSDGDYKFWVQAQDNADNWGDWGSTNFTIDTVPPPAATNLTNPGGSPSTDNTTPQVSWDGGTDSGSGIWTFVVKFYDGPGSNRMYPSGDETLDDVDYGSDSLEDGAWKWQVQTVDVAGNDTWSSYEPITIQSDTEGPYAPGDIRMSQSHDTAGESDSDGITYIGNPQFEWTKPSDRGTSGTKDYYQWAVTAASDNPWDGPRIVDDFTPDTSKRPGTLSDGDYKFWVQAQDNADNWGDWGSTNFTIDTVPPPAATNLTNPSGLTTDDATPQVTWTQNQDSGSGVWTYDVNFYDGPGSNRMYQSGDETLDDGDYSGDSLEDGAWKWQVHTVDVAGNDTWSSYETIIIMTGPLTINVNAENTAQVIDGFGGSFAMYGYAPDEEAFDYVIDDLGTAIVRTRGEYWGSSWGDERCREILERVQNADSSIKIMLSFWYPYWQDCPTDLQDDDGKLKPEYYDDWATAIVNRINTFRSNWGIDVDYVSIQNEPEIYHGGYTCLWEPAELATFIQNENLVQKLHDAGVTNVLLPENAYIGSFSKVQTWLQELNGVNIDIVDYHLYDGYAHETPDPGYTELKNRVIAFHNAVSQAFPSGKKTWMTETSGAWRIGDEYHTIGWSEGMSEEDKAITAAKYVHLALTEGSSNAVLWWALTWKVGTEDDREQSLILVDDSSIPMQFVEKTKKYYVFKQYSKYVRPGYIRIELSDVSPLLASAYKSSDEQTVVVVIINPESYDVDVFVSGLESYNLCQTLRTDNDANCEESVWDETAYSRSVITLVYMTSCPIIPHTPDPCAPEDDATLSSLTPDFEWSIFQDGGDGETQAGYQVRVRCDDTNEVIVYDTGFIPDASGYTHTYSPGSYIGFDPNSGSNTVSNPLEWGKHYHWHVRYRDSGGDWSLWSADTPETHQDFYTITCTPPNIISHPQSQTVCEGDPVTFNVSATGTGPFSYQWRKGGNDIGDANSSSYVINQVASADADSYDCVVTNACDSATSNAATLTVNTPPVITSHPSPPLVTICSGQSKQYCVVASGSGLSYQWQKDDSNIPGATSSCYMATQTGSYLCVVSNSCNSTPSNSATLTVYHSPIITQEPEDYIVKEDPLGGQDAFFTIIATGGELHYQWLWNGVEIPWAEDSPELVIMDVSCGDEGLISCIVSNNCGNTNSRFATLLVYCDDISIIVHPNDQTVSVGNDAVFTVDAESMRGFLLNYQWKKDGSEVGEDNPTLILSNVQLSDNGSIVTCEVSNRVDSVTSDPAVLTVNPLQYTITASAGPNGSIDPNGNIVKNLGEDQLFTATPNDPNYIIAQWYLDGNSVQSGGTTYTIYNIQSDHTVYVTFRIAAPITIYVDNDAPNDPEPNNPDISDPNEDGSPEHPFDAIQEAIDYALEGDTIIVLEGRYYENIYFTGRNILTSTNPNDPNVVANTIIDGNNFGSVISVMDVNGPDANAVIDGFTITNGFADNGGGIYVSNANPTIKHCVIKSNSATDSGGGVYLESSCASIDFVTVGNPGNANDDTGYGSVSYEYQIGKYEVTAGQYTEFLNAVAATDTYGLYNTTMEDISISSKGCNIQRNGSEGSYTYSVAADWADRPVNYVNYYDCLRFANWLHNGQPTGGQTAATTEDGVYDMTLGSNVVSKVEASFWIPSEDEWYKAAYHKNDGVTGNYFDYPTSSDSTPSNDLIDPDPGNNATFFDNDWTIGSPYYRTEVGAHENSDSPYGTFDMGGNVWERNEALIDSRRGLRGGGFGSGVVRALSSSARNSDYPNKEDTGGGFRVASVPEPCSPALLSLTNITNCIIAQNDASEGGALAGGAGEIVNCTIANNSSGIKDFLGDITNSIIWGNADYQVMGQDCNNVTYCDIEDSVCSSEVGNVYVDPCFVDPNYEDYHLKSEVGCWDPNVMTWVSDDVTSPCIDAGDPNSDWTAELWPHGKRINMGAYGGTPEASMSLSNLGNIADLNYDDRVDFDDYAYLAGSFQIEQVLLPEDLDRNGIVDFNDVYIFTYNFLARAGAGLVGHWKFDEGSGQIAYDSSGYGNDGQLGSTPNADQNDPAWVELVQGWCLDFDGNMDYVKTEDTTIGLDFAPHSFSSSAWINARQVTDGWKTILEYERDGHYRNRFGLWLNYEGRFHFRVGLDTINSEHILNYNEWYLLTATYDSTTKTMSLYINGQFDASGTHSRGFSSPSAAKLTIGVRGWEDAEYFDGLIDDVRIYDYALSEYEVEALADSNGTLTIPQYELTASVIGGRGTVSPASGSYQEGTVVTLTATPDPGYKLQAWQGTDNDSSTSTTNTATMDSDKTVTVEFEAKPTLKLLWWGSPAPDEIVTMPFEPDNIGIYLESGATCNSLSVAFIVDYPYSFDCGSVTFPTGFDMGPWLGMCDPQLVEVEAWQMFPPVSGYSVIVHNLLLFNEEYWEGWVTLSLVVTYESIINGETIPAGTVLHEVEIIWY